MVKASVVAAAMLVAASGAHAADVAHVSQKNKQFVPGEITVKVGEPLQISNDDPRMHHVYVDTPDFKFDSGEQPPGKTVVIRFPEPGEYLLQCAIHPKMRLTVTVK